MVHPICQATLSHTCTGYGTCYFAGHGLAFKGDSWEGKRCAVSGSGNVAEYTVEKLLEYGAVPISMSDSDGTIIEEDGFTTEKLNMVRKVKGERRRISEYQQFSKTAKYYGNGARPWDKTDKIDMAFPSATQNEINLEDAKALVERGCKYVAEGANMPTETPGIEYFKENGVLFLPAKAANAGGVAVSGLEMAQNAGKLYWNRQTVDDYLKEIMKNIWGECVEMADHLGQPGNIQLGANASGFRKVADAMFEQGMLLPFDANKIYKAS